MKVNLAKLRNELRSMTKTQGELRSKLAAGRGTLTQEEVNSIENELYASFEKAEECRNAIFMEEAQRENERILAMRDDNESAHENRAGRANQEYRAAFNNYLRNGFASHMLSNEDKKVLSEFRAQNTQDPSLGGYVVDTETIQTVQEEKFTWGALFALARKLRTQRGNSINWPVSKEGLRRGVIVGEAQNHGKTETQFSSRTLGAHKMSSQIILVSDELLQDAYIDIAAYVTRIARQRVELGIDYYMVHGQGGDNEPLGLIKSIPKNQKVNITLPTDPDAKRAAIFDAFIKVEHRVNSAYRKMPGFYRAISDSTLEQIRMWKDKNGNPIYIRDPKADWPETLFGDRLVIDNELPPLGENGCIIAGNFNSLVVREAGDMIIKRFDELYGETGQVGFLAWQRFGVVLEDESAFAMAVFDGSGEDTPVDPFHPMKTSQDGFEDESE